MIGIIFFFIHIESKKMEVYKCNTRNTIIALIIYWLCLSLNVIIAKELELSELTEWWLNTIVFLIIVFLSILTYRTGLNIYLRILFIPAAWLVHAILTIPAAQVLGILMFDPDHIRTSGEQRAVFLLASLPVLIFFMNKSTLFTKQLTN